MEKHALQKKLAAQLLPAMLLLALVVVTVAIRVSALSPQPPPPILLNASFMGPMGAAPWPGDTAVLRVEWLYRGPYVADQVYAVVHLPGIFGPSSFSAQLGAAAPGDTLELVRSINVAQGAASSRYQGLITLYIVVGGNVYTYNYTVELEVAGCPAGLRISAGLEPFSYPGSNNVELRVMLENRGPEDVENVTLTLRLPDGWQPTGNISWNIEVLWANSSETHMVPGVYVPAWIEPGLYNATLGMSYYCVVGNTTRFFNYTFSLPIRVEQPRPLRVEPLVLGWRAGVAYPGEASAPLDIVLLNQEPVTVTAVIARVELPSGMRVAGTANETYTAVVENIAASYGDTIRLSIDINIDERLPPGFYNASAWLRFVVSSQGATTILPGQLVIPLLVASPGKLNVDVVYMGWSGGYAYPGELSAPLRVVVQNLEDSTVTTAMLVLELPRGFAADGRRVATITLDNVAAGYGDLVEFTAAIDVSSSLEPGSYMGNMTLVFIMSSSGGTRIKYVRLPLRLDLSPRSVENVSIVSSRWSMWIVGDDAYAATAVIDVGYWGRGRLRYLVVTVEPIEGAGLRAGAEKLTLVQQVELAPGDIASVSIPGIRVYNASQDVSLNVTMTGIVVSPSGGVYNVTFSRIIRLELLREEPLQLGYTKADTGHILPSSSNVEVYVHVVNTAPEPVTILSAEPLEAPNIKAWLSGGDCITARVEPGSSCTLVLMLNVSSTASPGSYSIPLRLWYSYRGNAGSVVTGRQVLSIPLEVEPIEAYDPSPIVARAYWAPTPGVAPVKVYPGTGAAPLQLELYNTGRYTVIGVVVRLEPLDKGLHVVEQPAVCNSLAPGSTCSLTAYVDVDPEAEPGLYRVRAVISYIFTAFNAHLNITHEETITLQVTDPAEAIGIVDLSWASAPRPGTRSAMLVIMLYPDPSQVARIHSVVLELPQGLSNPQTSGSTVIAVPQASLQMTPSATRGGQTDIASIASIIQGLESTTSGVEVYLAQVAVNVTEPGPKPIALTVYWVDRLGYLHRVEKRLQLYVPGAPSILSVHFEPYAKLRGGVAELDITIINTGDAPVYNVYTVLVPTSAAGYPHTSVRHIPVLEPGKPVKLNYTLVYNPAGFGGVESYTFTGVLTAVYEDMVGRMTSFNTSIAVIMKPTILLRITSMNAEWRNGTVLVKGVIANEGIESAEAIRVDAVADGIWSSSFLGSLDPSSETPFRIELNTVSKPDNVTVVISYSDRYGITYSFNATAPVVEARPEKSLSEAKGVEAEPPIPEGGLNMITVVLLMLAVIVGYIAYRRFRRIPSENQLDSLLDSGEASNGEE
ncbi:hypothetical protein Pdsh_09865 [Pyrodictium delaneyi]|uniref:Alpha-galactosidase NEW3 domain-containing protein n=1 Tax=Pyrodictium delaneyi TaxID=1273541 RepID=A0A211YM75_9CREN|nr:hypothetical protein Pdsh_09865 [Pyrodictium delaneyi]